MGFVPSVTVILGVLLACINVVSIRCGKAIHGFVVRRLLFSSVYVKTSLVDMYAKCGSINHAIRLFRIASEKTLPLYNALISGYALHGNAKEALRVYKNMNQLRIFPDDITFTGLLSACSHAGLLLEGLEIFHDMVRKYHVTPTKEHYGCLTTLFARHGCIEEVHRMLSSMAIKPDGHIIGSLLSFNKENHEMEVSESLMLHLLDLEPDNLANFFTLANIYSASGQWQKALKVRQLVKRSGLSKHPGYSSIQIGNESNTFTASDRSHPQIESITETVLCLHTVMKSVPCANSDGHTFAMEEDVYV